MKHIKFIGNYPCLITKEVPEDTQLDVLFAQLKKSDRFIVVDINSEQTTIPSVFLSATCTEIKEFEDIDYRLNLLTYSLRLLADAIAVMPKDESGLRDNIVQMIQSIESELPKVTTLDVIEYHLLTVGHIAKALRLMTEES